MASVEDRIVRMEFDNASFERKIASTIASLGQLDKAMKFTDAQKGLSGLSDTAKRFDLSNMSSALDNISSKFTALGAIGFSVIQQLTQSVLSFVAKVGGDVFGPIFTGGLARAKNIEQAKFMFEGLGISIEEGMASALAAVKGTAFGLDEAAKAAAQFGASGIQVGAEMTGALRGVAGAAAMTGRSFSEIADIFAGSAGTGKVTNQDLMQFATRGLNAAAALAKVLGKTEAQIHEMAAAGELDFKTFATAMDQAFGAHATEANKTFTGALANMRAAMSRMGAAVISPQLTHFRDIFNSLTPVIDNITAAFQPLIDTFSVITGYLTEGLIRGINGISFDNLKAAMPSLVEGFKNIYVALKTIWDIGKAAFQNIFPPGAESIVVKIADGFKALTAALIPGAEGASKLKSIFQGFFAALSIGWTILKEGVKFIAGLAKSIAGLAGPGVLGFFTKLADGLTNLQASLVKGGGIKNFFDGLTRSLQKPIELLGKVKEAIASVFDGFKAGISGEFGDSLGRITDRVSSLKDSFSNIIGAIAEPLQRAFNKITEVLENVFNKIREWATTLGKRIGDLLRKGDFSGVADAINLGLLATIALLLNNFIKKGLSVFVTGTLNIAGNLVDQISSVFGELNNTLKAMQASLKAQALIKIATAIAILTASVLVLSLIDSVALTKALTAMAVGFAQLMGSFAIFAKLAATPKAAASFTVVSSGLVVLATALLILSGAVAILSSLSWEELARGMSAITGLLALLVVATKPLAANSKGMIAAGVGLTAMAVALTILGGAMKIFATLSWEDMAKGMIGVVGSLVGIGLAMKLFPPGPQMALMGIGLLGVAVAMNILAGALAIFGHMKWEVIGKGMLALAGSLVIIGLAMQLMPANLPITAAGLILVGVALNMIAAAMKVMGSMSWAEIARGLVALAGAMIIIAVGANAMQAALPGAAAMLVMAFALTILATALKIIGSMSWGDIAKGLITIALAMTIIAAASFLLSEAIPFILAFGVAMLLLGAGFLLIGASAYLLAKALALVAKSGEAAAKALPAVLRAIGRSIPALMQGIAEGVLEMIQIFVDALPQIASAIGKLLGALLDEIIKLIPKLGTAIALLMEEMFRIIQLYIPKVIETGLLILTSLLKGIRDNIGPIVHLVGDIITNFLNAFRDEIPRVVTSLKETIITFFEETAEGLGEIAGTLLFGIGIKFIEGFFRGLESSLGLPEGFFRELPGKILGWIGDAASWLWQKGVDIIAGLARGIGERFNSVIAWFGGLPSSIAGYFGNAVNWLLDAGRHIIDGLIEGMKAAWHEAEDFLGGLKDKVENILSGKFLFGSPSKVMEKFGELIMLGMDIGMKNTWEDTANWLDTVPKEVTDKMTAALSAVSNEMSKVEEFNPTITPVLDLTQVAAGAAKISSYIPSSAALSYSQARIIASAQNAQQVESIVEPTVPGDVRFEQNIYAPTQLSTSDIYKQTRNQIRIAKEELSIP